MKYIITTMCYVLSLILFNMSMDNIYLNKGINPYIGLPLSLLILSIGYVVIHKTIDNSWKAKEFHRYMLEHERF